MDARLGVEGLPQSGTGQTSIVTGINAAKHMGRHYGPVPGPTIKPLIRDHSTPVLLTRAGGTLKLLNFYPPTYAPPGGKHGAIVQSVLDAGEILNPEGFPSIRPSLGMHYQAPYEPYLPLNEIRAWGRAAARAAREVDLVMLDLWFSDFIGHAQDAVAARNYLIHLNAFLEGAVEHEVRIFMTSDHGNMEDTNIKTHTFARVPFVSAGFEASEVRDIAEAGAEIKKLLGLASSEG
ncbi:hypothetical protein DC3_51140 [Deinococcus cellulosilyticus NBRC 106333 = KACC 11606]|uniref:Metalloenzyme domain-containing protein n=1 Tax=Deinococcus cellulosilyticus (strain DSM 18568 / NBRC 106333 / KACC 11606 / 5516J-15) TaxID=1223518 RepID=A0A511N9G3_DEIC1|nr:hypothetical protein DC3_51140 [Deinococcus cellulosilyticus NBRC 106333 = KACC 11606]